jgi:hypothetical protein
MDEGTSMGTGRWSARAIVRWGAVVTLAVAGAAAGGCGIIGEGVEQASKAAEISLQTPGTLGGAAQLPNFSGTDPNVADQPPGMSTIIAGYGANDIPLYTLNAYTGAPAGIAVVRKSYEAAVGGQKVGTSQCTAQTQELSVCYRSQDNLLVAVAAVGKNPEETAKIVDEAWQSVRS